MVLVGCKKTLTLTCQTLVGVYALYGFGGVKKEPNKTKPRTTLRARTKNHPQKDKKSNNPDQEPPKNIEATPRNTTRSNLHLETSRNKQACMFYTHTHKAPCFSHFLAVKNVSAILWLSKTDIYTAVPFAIDVSFSKGCSLFQRMFPFFKGCSLFQRMFPFSKDVPFFKDVPFCKGCSLLQRMSPFSKEYLCSTVLALTPF